MQGTGRGERQSLLITIYGNGSILEEEKFFYADNADTAVDPDNLDIYLDFD